MTGLKGVSKMKLHRELGMRHVIAWHLLHRVRAELLQEDAAEFAGVVEEDGTFIDNKYRMRTTNESSIS